MVSIGIGGSEKESERREAVKTATELQSSTDPYLPILEDINISHLFLSLSLYPLLQVVGPLTFHW